MQIVQTPVRQAYSQEQENNQVYKKIKLSACFNSQAAPAYCANVKSDWWCFFTNVPPFVQDLKQIYPIHRRSTLLNSGKFLRRSNHFYLDTKRDNAHRYRSLREREREPRRILLSKKLAMKILPTGSSSSSSSSSSSNSSANARAVPVITATDKDNSMLGMPSLITSNFRLEDVIDKIKSSSLREGVAISLLFISSKITYLYHLPFI